LLVLLLSLVARAAPPVMVSDGDVLTGTVDVAVAPEALRARLSDPTWLPTISRDGTEVSVVRPDGPCQVLQSVSPSTFLTVRYQTRRCPTADGFHSTLIESNAFSTYETSWTILPDGAGARVTYRIHVVSTLWVPKGVIRRNVRSGIESMLVNMQDWARDAGR
jgi:hypothetical protein